VRRVLKVKAVKRTRNKLPKLRLKKKKRRKKSK